MRAQIAEVGWALQSALGSPETDPAYAVGVEIGLPAIQETRRSFVPVHPAASASMETKQTTTWQTATTTLCYLGALGVLAKAILPTEQVSGSGPYTHSFTPGDDERYLTLFSQVEGLTQRFEDGVIESLIFDWQESAPVRVTVQATGLRARRLNSAYTPGHRVAGARVASPIGGTFELDWDDTGYRDVLLTGGAVWITRPLIQLPATDGLLASRLFRRPWEVHLSLELAVEDWDGLRATFYGGVGGNQQSEAIVYGKCRLTFPTPDGRYLRIRVPHVSLAWEPPDVGRGVLVARIEGRAVQGPQPLVELILLNDVSGTY